MSYRKPFSNVHVTNSFRLYSGETAASRSRRNPIPKGTPLSGFDLFDEGVALSTPPPSGGLYNVKRGDVLKVRSQQWLVFKVLGDLQVLVYKYPSKKQKIYEMRIARPDSRDIVEVFQVGGSGQKISDVLVEGEVAFVKHLDEHEM